MSGNGMAVEAWTRLSSREQEVSVMVQLNQPETYLTTVHGAPEEVPADVPELALKQLIFAGIGDTAKWLAYLQMDRTPSTNLRTLEQLSGPSVSRDSFRAN
jgi:hypothetical protein